MEEQKKTQDQENNGRALEQDGPLKNSDKHGHWFRSSQNDTGSDEDSIARTEQKGADQQPTGISDYTS